MNKQYDIIVIGAGPGGATFASLAAHEGKKVLVVDKNPAAGGKMMTIHKDGHYYEMFPLNLIPFAPSLFEKLMEITGKNVRNVAAEIKENTHTFYIDEKGKIVELRFAKKNILNILKDFGATNPIVMIRVMSLFKKLLSMKEDELNKLNHISAYDYMQQQKVPDTMKVFLTASMGEGAFEMTSDMVPASHMIRMFQLATSLEHPQPRYYEGGVGGFFTRQLETVTENGGDIIYNTKVAKIIIEDGIAKGIITSRGEEFFAPIVVSSAGIRQTVKFLAGESNFPAEYTEKIRNLHSNLSDVGYRYFTTKKILPESTYVLFPYDCLEPWSSFEEMAEGKKKPTGNYVYIGTKSVYPTIGPEDGRQVIYAVMSCVPKLDQDFTPYLEYIEKRVASVFPELYEDGVIERKEIMTLKAACALGVEPLSDVDGGESYGVADAIGQADEDLPRTETPVQGLYIVGNDVEGFGVGTHRAVDSGFKVYNKIFRKKA